ncbi:IclR family transcriptional regulator [uncultured Alsobacter sp.]|uniref:IclR family transcriptional regulator n=1 Tax=uncultured Alsobacter sp. TaxID=1748258 RepID=UPI0025E53FE7|nr:IclR family transcriptional regulator [uncultured Alsobacter sp.]
MKSREPAEGTGDASQTLRRGLNVLKLLTRFQADGLGVSEIARRLQLSKTTAVRLTRTLLDERFVAQDSTSRRYRLGPEAYAVGLAAEPSYALQRVAAPILRSLAMETGDWIFFTVRHGLEAICISRASANKHYPQKALRVGDRHPLGLGTGGLAILAAMPDTQVEETINANARVYGVVYPKMSAEIVRKEVIETRRRGYAFVPGTLSPGYWGVGVPILQGTDNPVAAIVLVSTADRMGDQRRAALGDRLQRLAGEVMDRAWAPSQTAGDAASYEEA